MTTTDLLKQALHALELESTNPGLGTTTLAIHDLRDALAQPTSAEYAQGYAEGFEDACKPKPQGVPVAWIENHKAGQNLSWEPVNHPYAKATPLFTHPAAPAPADNAALREQIEQTTAMAKEATSALASRDRAMDALREELAAARRTGQMWKAEHLAGNAVIEALRADHAAIVDAYETKLEGLRERVKVLETALEEAADEIERLTRELANALVNDVHSCHAGCTRAGCVAAGLRKDAERYRWLRDKARTVDWTQHIEHQDFCDAYECHTRIGPQGMDAAIDAARAKP